MQRLALADVQIKPAMTIGTRDGSTLRVHRQRSGCDIIETWFKALVDIHL
jgi:hypothetical protein